MNHSIYDCDMWFIFILQLLDQRGVNGRGLSLIGVCILHTAPPHGQEGE